MAPRALGSRPPARDGARAPGRLGLGLPPLAEGVLLARTDWSVPKHRGITYFAIRMHQPGVHVRPLRQMNGYASFNEVFLDDARVPVTDVVGDVNDGWRVALTTLMHERGLTTLRQP